MAEMKLRVFKTCWRSGGSWQRGAKIENTALRELDLVKESTKIKLIPLALSVPG